jgi:23S rRNA pseudouridine2604 synthase
VNHSKSIFPIGRLDKDSQGLIFLTNNGDMVNKILRAGNNHEKEYVVTVNKHLTEAVIQGMANGVPMMGVTTRKCKIVQEGPTVFRIVLVQGLNRQIRRMCEYFGYEVTKLERVRIMNISLKGLPLGDWRDLTETEMNTLYSLIESSVSDDVKKSKTGTKKTTTTTKTNHSPHSKTTDSRKNNTTGSSKRNAPKSSRNNQDNRNRRPASKSNNKQGGRRSGR